LIRLVLIFLLLVSSPINATVTKCNFEEIYPNGDIQQGILFYEKNNLRYQYLHEDLYTLIFNENLYLIRNRDTNKFEKIRNNSSVIRKIVDIYNDFPNIKNNYNFQDSNFIIEKSHNEKYIKRLAILSEGLNLSIHLYGCSKSEKNKDIFQFNPFIVYNN